MPDARVQTGVAVRLYPRFYFARLHPGFVVHVWRIWITRTSDESQRGVEADDGNR